MFTHVGLRAGRFVELDHERACSWKHWNPYDQLENVSCIGQCVFLNFVLMCCDMDLDQEVLDCVMSG